MQKKRFCKSIFKSKKGLSHVDWAIGLSIFLLYLAWFFIFVKPTLTPSENMDTLQNILVDAVNENLYQEVNMIEVLVVGGEKEEFEPVSIPFTRNWTTSKISNSADWFEIDEGKMYFLVNTSSTQKYSIFYPHDGLRYTSKPIVNANEEEARYDDFRAEFDNYLLDELYYSGKKRIWDYTVTVDGEEIDDTGEFEDHEIFAKYRRDGEVNHTTRVFAKNSRLYNSIVNEFRAQNGTVEFTAYNYTNYFIDASNSGNLTYHIVDRCKYYETDFLDLYGDGTGLAIMFDQNVTLKLCTNETNVKVWFGFDIADEVNYDIFLHDGDYRKVNDYPIDVRVGTVETMDTVSREQVLSYKNRDYGLLKEEWEFPDERDFNITISGEDISASYGARQPEAKDIYAKKMKGYVIGKDFTQQQVNITLTVW